MLVNPVTGTTQVNSDEVAAYSKSAADSAPKNSALPEDTVTLSQAAQAFQTQQKLAAAATENSLSPAAQALQTEQKLATAAAEANSVSTSDSFDRKCLRDAPTRIGRSSPNRERSIAMVSAVAAPDSAAMTSAASPGTKCNSRKSIVRMPKMVGSARSAVLRSLLRMRGVELTRTFRLAM